MARGLGLKEAVFGCSRYLVVIVLFGVNAMLSA